MHGQNVQALLISIGQWLEMPGHVFSRFNKFIQRDIWMNTCSKVRSWSTFNHCHSRYTLFDPSMLPGLLSSLESSGACGASLLRGWYSFFFFCEGLLPFAANHRSMLGSALKQERGILSLFRSRRLSKDVFVSRDCLSTLIVPRREKTLSSFPFNAGRENDKNIRPHSWIWSVLKPPPHIVVIKGREGNVLDCIPNENLSSLHPCLLEYLEVEKQIFQPICQWLLYHCLSQSVSPNHVKQGRKRRLLSTADLTRTA